MSRNDQAVTALETLTGQTGNYNDLILAWLQDNGATSGDICDAWHEYLDGQSIGTGCLNDRWYEWLTGLGYSGSLSDMFYALWAAGGPAGSSLAFHALTYDPTTYEMLGVKTGTGSLTTTHADALYAPDKDGVYQKFPANAPVWAGGRCVLTGGAGSDVSAVYADDGTGTLLASLPWLQYYPAATNSLKYSNDQTNTGGWPGSSSWTRNQTGLTGAANTACSSTTGYSTQVLTVSDDSATHTLRVWYAKGATTNRPRAALRLVGGTEQNRYVQIDLSDGSYVGGSGVGTYSYEVVEDGNWWVLLIQVQNNSTGNVNGYVTLEPVFGGTAGCTVGQAELHLNKTIAQVRGLGPIFTTSAAVSVAAVSPISADDANHSDTAGAYYFEWEPSAATSELSGNHQLLSLNNGADLVYYDATAGAIKSTDGTNTASVSLTVAKGTTYKIGLAYDASNLNVCADSTWGTAQSYDGGFPAGTELDLMNSMANGHEIRNLRRYDITSYADGKDIVDGLMA